MTEPTPGQQDQDHSDYDDYIADLRTEQDTETTTEIDQPAAPPRRSVFAGRSRLVTTVVAALVVLVGAAASVWWFSGRTSGPGNQVAAPPSRSAPHPSRRRPAPTPDNSAYGVGTCITEPQDPTTSGLELKPVPCSGDDAVLMVNQVVQQYSDCESSADYIDHGFLLTDEAANVTYCLSLVVPTNQCFEFSTNNSQPIQRAACGSAPNVVQVKSIEPATSASAACTDQTDPDIWFYQSPTSGQFACVTSQPPSSSTAPTAPTAPTSGPAEPTTTVPGAPE